MSHSYTTLINQGKDTIVSTTICAPSPSDPAPWHRYPCQVDGSLIITGDLDPRPEIARTQLDVWVALGVTHIVDVRGEWTDENFVGIHAPEIDYIYVGTDDNGGPRSDAWFDSVLAALDNIIFDPTAVVLVHCHMGVNRGPSMAFRIMLEQGWDAIDALEALRAARPIANVLYADSAIDHFHRSHETATPERVKDIRRVRAWRDANALDVSWIISRIRRASDE